MARKVGSHVEYPSRRYYGAFGLSYMVANVTDALVERALRKSPPMPTTSAIASVRSGTAGSLGKTGKRGDVYDEWMGDRQRVEAGEMLGQHALATLKVRGEQPAVEGRGSGW